MKAPLPGPPLPHRCLNQVCVILELDPKRNERLAARPVFQRALRTLPGKVSFLVHGDQPGAKHFSLLPKTLTAAALSMDGKMRFQIYHSYSTGDLRSLKARRH